MIKTENTEAKSYRTIIEEEQGAIIKNYRGGKNKTVCLIAEAPDFVQDAVNTILNWVAQEEGETMEDGTEVTKVKLAEIWPEKLPPEMADCIDCENSFKADILDENGRCPECAKKAELEPVEPK